MSAHNESNRRSVNLNNCDRCVKCAKNVFAMEKIVIDDKIMHENCFVCETCKSKLGKTGHNKWGDNYYCLKDFLAAKKIQPAKSILSPRSTDLPASTRVPTTDSATATNNASNASNSTTNNGNVAATINTNNNNNSNNGRATAAKNMCMICEKRVFSVEGVLLDSDETVHKSCFTCSECAEPLTLANCHRVDEKFFCPRHFYKRSSSDLNGYKQKRLFSTLDSDPLQNELESLEQHERLNCPDLLSPKRDSAAILALIEPSSPPVSTTSNQIATTATTAASVVADVPVEKTVSVAETAVAAVPDSSVTTILDAQQATTTNSSTTTTTTNISGNTESNEVKSDERANLATAVEKKPESKADSPPPRSVEPVAVNSSAVSVVQESVKQISSTKSPRKSKSPSIHSPRKSLSPTKDHSPPPTTTAISSEPTTTTVSENHHTEKSVSNNNSSSTKKVEALSPRVLVTADARPVTRVISDTPQIDPSILPITIANENPTTTTTTTTATTVTDKLAPAQAERSLSNDPHNDSNSAYATSSADEGKTMSLVPKDKDANRSESERLSEAERSANRSESERRSETEKSEETMEANDKINELHSVTENEGHLLEDDHSLSMSETEDQTEDDPDAAKHPKRKLSLGRSRKKRDKSKKNLLDLRKKDSKSKLETSTSSHKDDKRRRREKRSAKKSTPSSNPLPLTDSTNPTQRARKRDSSKKDEKKEDKKEEKKEDKKEDSNNKKEDHINKKELKKKRLYQ